MAAEADLDRLRQSHPYTPFAIAALKLLRKCQVVLEQDQSEWEQRNAAPLPEPELGQDGHHEECEPGTSKRKRKRKTTLRTETMAIHPDLDVSRGEMYEHMGDHPSNRQHPDLETGYYDAEHGLQYVLSFI